MNDVSEDDANEGDDFFIVCPRCDELVHSIYEGDKLEIDEPCSCLNDMSEEEWCSMVYELWNDFSIIRVPDSFGVKNKKDKSIKQWQEDIHSIARESGWYSEKREFGEFISLFHSELSESLEEFRNNKPYLYYQGDKPEGWAVELVDTMIRILDFMESEGIDTDMLLELKCNYNSSRDYRHGDKKI